MIKVEVWRRNIKTHEISEHHELRIGTYNEFYLPSVDLHYELWIKITDEQTGEETKLHLKR